MLTGLIEQTKGTANIYGINIFKDMQKVRQLMGVCPQHDVHFELLTTQEHISLFYDLKGADRDPLIKSAHVDKLMKDVGVYDKKNTLASQLSGGNKRKLSVAIALCGGSSFVVLDEPTSGMDLSARRQLWNMLKEYKKNRIILLTTHYMDEADIIGDRIAIMVSGNVKCAGSSLYLKNRFGSGYNFAILLQDLADSQKIKSYFEKGLGKNIQIQSQSQREITLLVPFEYSKQFSTFLINLDQNLTALLIQSYGISISTLEEVFLKVGIEDQPHQHETSQVRDGKIDPNLFNLGQNVKILDKSFQTNFIALLTRRYNCYKRNKRALFNESILPAIIMLLGTSLQQVATTWQSPSRLLSPDRLPKTQRVLVNTFLNSSDEASDIISNLPHSFFKIIQSQNDTNFVDFQQQVIQFSRDKQPQDVNLYGSYQIYEANRSSQQYAFTSIVNLTSQDATGLFPQFMYESVLKTATEDPDFKFQVRSVPFPPTYEVKIRYNGPNTGTIIFLSSITYSMMITAVVSYLVVERTNGLKHLQLVSGMQLQAYWISNFSFDFIKFLPTILTTLALFKFYDMKITAAWTVFLAFPFGILPFTYVSSFLFTEDGAAQTFTMFFHFLTLAILSSIVFALRLVPDRQIFGDNMHTVMKSVPSYLIGSSLYCDKSCQVLSNSRLRANATGSPLDPDKWGPTNIPSDLKDMFLHFLFWICILVVIETNLIKRILRMLKNQQRIDFQTQQIDEDVLREQKEVQQTEVYQNQDIRIQVNNLHKQYSIKNGNPFSRKNFLAVNGLSFQVGTGECFALLGVNGAGKSTTYKSLTGEVEPTSGSVKICGFDLQKEFQQARKTVGYCPQANLLFDFMTVEEHIQFYARIKGVPSDLVQSVVDQNIVQLDLTKQSRKLAGTLSGGNKRKLCVSIALIGCPPVILLDEPSAGMDPAARRFMWSILYQQRQRKTSSIVISTHSMDEAETLSTKMGIMVKGGILKCLGSAQHIKSKFGMGYIVEIKIHSVDQNLEKRAHDLPFHIQTDLATAQAVNLISQYSIEKAVNQVPISDQLKQEFKNRITQSAETSQMIYHCWLNFYKCLIELCYQHTSVQVLETYGNYMRIRLPNKINSIGSVFSLLESMRNSCDVSEYSVNQTTLEQIFQGFADLNYDLHAQGFTLQEGVLVRLE